MLEKQIESYLNKKVKSLKGLSFKWISSVTGVPDRIVMLNKHIHLVELKTAKGVLSPRQCLVFAEIEQQGFPVHVLKSKEDVDEFIESVKKC